MSGLTERLEVRIDSPLMDRLREEARRRRRSVGQLVREAIERHLAEESEGRRQAAEALFAVGASIDDWPELEREIEAARAEGCG